MSLGKILALSALYDDKYSCWIPSYGAEVRGGTAHCFVKISDSFISSPLVEEPDIALIFNQPSLDKFERRLSKNSLLVVNTDLLERQPSRKGIRVIPLALNRLALECGNIKLANIIALGVLNILEELFKRENIIKALKGFFFAPLFHLNLKAFSEGERIGKNLKENKPW